MYILSGEKMDAITYPYKHECLLHGKVGCESLLSRQQGFTVHYGTCGCVVAITYGQQVFEAVETE